MAYFVSVALEREGCMHHWKRYSSSHNVGSGARDFPASLLSHSQLPGGVRAGVPTRRIGELNECSLAIGSYKLCIEFK